MTIKRFDYRKLVLVLNNGIEQIMTGEPDEEQVRAVEYARKLVEELGYKAC